MTKQISPLRQRMIDDMAFRNMSPSAQRSTLMPWRGSARFHLRSPDKLGLEQGSFLEPPVRLELAEAGCPRPSELRLRIPLVIGWRRQG